MVVDEKFYLIYKYFSFGYFFFALEEENNDELGKFRT